MKSRGLSRGLVNVIVVYVIVTRHLHALHTYTNVLQRGDIPTLSKMFGLKKESDILKYKRDIIHELSMKAIERYTGVAFDYLGYEKLDTNTQEYIDRHVNTLLKSFWSYSCFRPHS